MRKITKPIDEKYRNCPIRNVIDKFGDKWSLLVLWQLDTKGTLRFGELHREMSDCSQKSFLRPSNASKKSALSPNKFSPKCRPAPNIQ